MTTDLLHSIAIGLLAIAGFFQARVSRIQQRTLDACRRAHLREEVREMLERERMKFNLYPGSDPEVPGGT